MGKDKVRSHFSFLYFFFNITNFNLFMGEAALLHRINENNSPLKRLYASGNTILKRSFKFEWYRKPPPACLAALHKKEKEQRRAMKETAEVKNECFEVVSSQFCFIHNCISSFFLFTGQTALLLQANKKG